MWQKAITSKAAVAPGYPLWVRPPVESCNCASNCGGTLESNLPHCPRVGRRWIELLPEFAEEVPQVSVEDYLEMKGGDL